MDINCSSLEEETIAPHAGNEFLAAECPTVFCGQCPEEIELFTAQPDLFIVDFDLKANTVDVQVSDLYDRHGDIDFHDQPT